ncbi:ribonuclease H family protein [Lactiplantibacillus paraplantarum]|uniref:ribonuclease H family protein n=1 Tax=Lactiplantibacillus paraplantarum TaxID=60520 RepID=UPI0023AB1264|nr:ribonuclease H family protein [Lactiplantibacillus paraplantarum]WEE35189.1 ribonuclease H family protein [Lactiplantibacillus paraplantarum]
MAQKYYAVRKGRHPGIYRTWPETQKQVSGYPQAQYKSFPTAAAAQAFMAGQTNLGSTTPAKKQTATNQAPVNAAITVYTDGGSRNTGNVAGQHVHQDDKAAWAYRIEMPDQLVTDSAGEWGATNNRMEIMAFLRALEQLQQLGQTKTSILFVLDSQYVLNAVTKGWLAGWKRRGWKRSNGPLVNAELWQAVDRLLPQFTTLNYRWTKGHATNQGNVFVDHLLNQTMDQMHPGQPVTPSTGARTSTSQSADKPTTSTPRSKAADPTTVSQSSATPQAADPKQVARSVAAIKKMLRK